MDDLTQVKTLTMVDGLRTGDFACMALGHHGELRVHTLPKGVLAFAWREDDCIVASVDLARVSELPDAPILYVDQMDVTNESATPGAEAGCTRHIPLLPVRVDEVATRTAELRAELSSEGPPRQHAPVITPSALQKAVLLYRDTSTCDGVAHRYEPGRIIMERGNVDATWRCSKMTESLRYLILTSEAHAQGPHGTGLCTVLDHSYFLVVDNYVAPSGHRQVMLLHVPRQIAHGAFLKGVKGSELHVLRTYYRADFLSSISGAKPPIAALTTGEWRDRLTDPVGLSDDGEWFYDAWCDPCIWPHWTFRTKPRRCNA